MYKRQQYAGFYEWDSAQEKFANSLEGDQEFVLGEFLKGGEYEAWCGFYNDEHHPLQRRLVHHTACLSLQLPVL